MVLFIHDFGSSPSLWLQQIQTMFKLDTMLSDTELLDLFTIQLPGHNNKDAHFSEDEVFTRIEDKVSQYTTLQKELANRLILTHDQHIIELLQSEKVTIVGDGVGGSLGLLFGLQKPDIINRFVLIDSANSYRKIYTYCWERILRSSPLSPLRKRFPEFTTKLKQAKSYITSTFDTSRLSATLDWIKTFSFLQRFESQTLDTQLSFINIPLLILNKNFSVKYQRNSGDIFRDIYNPTKGVFQIKKTTISDQSDRVMEKELYGNLGDGVLEERVAALIKLSMQQH